MVNKATKLLNQIENVFAVTAGLLILFSMFSVVLEVIARYFFNISFIWVNEYNEYMLLYITFLSGAWLLRHNGHVSIDIINFFVGRKFNYVLNVIAALIGIFLMIILVYYGTLVTVDAYERNATSTTPLRTLQVYIYMIIPIGSFVLLLEFMRQLFIANDIKSRS
ncbi:TRAP transporter small permease subunit [Salicibibacter kimchii]|uniref:TRAP transporter small permease n=1 Tax=Salicibibacter kimchii TaxID=2099786 RepID=A0A345C176_9BACI|nr:TRAP transporter small permease [Salicibibacter kimchii]AXF56957.1 TRAP transporter small permease [Salicibibacter kimchii]